VTVACTISADPAAALRAAVPGRSRLLDRPEGVATSFRSRIAHPDLRALYDYWLGRSSEAAVMARAALDPAAMPRLLKNLILADVGDGGQTICYRLVGTEIVAAHGFDFTGWSAERLTSGATLTFTRRLYGTVVTRAVPVYSEGHFRWVDKEYHWTKRLHLPLSRAGNGEVDLVLVGQFYEQQRGRGELVLAARPDEVAADRATLG
jgi:hypothetical protein